VKLGKEHQGDFTLMAKAYARIGNAYCAKKMYDEAVKAFDDSLLEEYEKKVEQKRTDIKKIRAKASLDEGLLPLWHPPFSVVWRIPIGATNESDE
jgi:hypothetical protein